VTTEHKIIATDIKRELPCKLTDAELLELAIAKTKTEAELDELRDEFRDVKSTWSDRIDDVEKRIAHMGSELRAGERKAVVICHERIDLATRMVEVVREDTLDVVDRRAANLFEAGKVLPHAKRLDDSPPGEEPPGVDDALAAAAAEGRDAAATQKSVNVEENDEGDVVPPEGDGKRAKKSKKVRS
jgi:hypothetical protein